MNLVSVPLSSKWVAKLCRSVWGVAFFLIPHIFNIKMKKPSRIPVVLSVQEVERFLNSFTNLKHKAIFTMIYSAGLRIGELLNLKIRDIDSDRLQIRIHQGKGQKDRYSLLSPKVLLLLREYVSEYKPKNISSKGSMVVNTRLHPFRH